MSLISHTISGMTLGNTTFTPCPRKTSLLDVALDELLLLISGAACTSVAEGLGNREVLMGREFRRSILRAMMDLRVISQVDGNFGTHF